MSLGLLLGSPKLLAQHSLPGLNIGAIHSLYNRAIGENFIGLQYLMQHPNLQLEEGQLKYLRTLSEIQHNDITQTDQSLFSGIEKERITLLKAISHYQQGDKHYTTSLALLNTLDLSPLYNYELQQARLLKAYLLLALGLENQYKEAETLLSLVMRQKDLLGDQATLYKSNLLWHRGNPKEAYKLLESRLWSDEIMPDVEYQGALLSYALEPASQALATTQKLLKRYPEFRNRPRLMGMMAKAYYDLEDFPNVLACLKGIDNEDLLPSENYLLGASLYQLKRYNEALLPLQKASSGDNKTRSLALFAIGNVYQDLADYSKAELSFMSSLKSSPTAKLREETLYRLLELGHSLGYDTFGSHMGMVQDFLSNYPQSTHRPRIMNIIRAYISRSKASNGLELIEQLRPIGLKLDDIKQKLLYKEAIQTPSNQRELYLQLLNKSILLGNLSPSYASALTARSDYFLRQKHYEEAKRDAELAITHAKKDSHLPAEYLLGYSLFNLKQYGSSIKHFESFTRNNKDQKLTQDALLRIGDSYLAINNLQEAVQSYKTAQNIDNGNEEALYRLSSIYTRLGQYEQQSKQVTSIKEYFPNSSYIPQMLYDKGRSERIKNLNKEAINTFTEIVEKYPISPIAPSAMLEQALIHTNLNQDTQAISTYKKLITKYPESKEAIVALSDLKSIYSDNNQLDEYLSYAKTLSGNLKPKQEDEAHIKYLLLESKSRRNVDITDELVSYLKEYPNSSDRLKVEKLLASTYQEKGEIEKSVQVLKQALSRGLQTENKVQVLLHLGDLYLASKQIQQAYTSYQEAYQNSMGSSTYTLKSGLGILISGLTLDKHGDDITVADHLLAQSKLATQEREQIQLLKAKHQETNKSFKAAINTYSTMEKSYNSPYGAEAIVRRADIQLRLNLIKDGINGLEAFIASGSNQNYWLARAFVLLSDFQDKQGDRYLAKQYIESLKENYRGNETDIQEMINTRLKKYSK